MKTHFLAFVAITLAFLVGCKPSIKVQRERFGENCLRYVTHGHYGFEELGKFYCECMWEQAASKFSTLELDSIWNDKTGIENLKKISAMCDTGLKEKMRSMNWPPSKQQIDSVLKSNGATLQNPFSR